MGSLSELILSADDLPRESVETPEWESVGVSKVFVRGLTAEERDQYEQGLTERTPDGTIRPRRNMRNLRASFVARVMVDDAGERVFSDKQIEALGGKSASVIDRLWTKGRELSGMSLEESQENPSEGDQDDDSYSD